VNSEPCSRTTGWGGGELDQVKRGDQRDVLILQKKGEKGNKPGTARASPRSRVSEVSSDTANKRGMQVIGGGELKYLSLGES